MAMSVKKIAEKLGISTTTVSIVLNNKSQGRIGNETVKRILEFCRINNYVPNVHAQRMNRHHSGIIAVYFAGDKTLDSFGNEGAHSELLAYIVDAVEKKGQRCMAMSMASGLTEANLLKMFLSREIDGMVFFGKPALPQAWKEVIAEHRLPTVCLACDPSDGIATVNIDNGRGMTALCAHLCEKGYKNLIGLGAEAELGIMAKERVSALKEAGGNKLKELILFPSYDESLAEEWVLSRFSSSRPMPKTAMVCMSDFFAFGALNGLRKLNLKVPEDLGVVGTDNFRICQYVTPKLTCMDSRLRTLSEAAIELLQDIIKVKKNIVRHVKVQPKLALRESC